MMLCTKVFLIKEVEIAETRVFLLSIYKKLLTNSTKYDTVINERRK